MENKNHGKPLLFKREEFVLKTLFFLSIGLIIWGITIYRITIIEPKYLIGVIAIGIIFISVTLSFWINTNYSFFWTFFINAIIGTGLFYFGFLFLNQHYSDSKVLTENFLIIETGNLAKSRRSNCSQPFAVIDFYGQEKELLFFCEFEKTIKNYHEITISYSDGLFGFPVIKEKQLKR